MASGLEQFEAMNQEAYSMTRVLGIARSVTGSISLVSSITLGCIIIRSRDGLSTVLHRIIFAFCISDVLFCIPNILSTLMVPETHADWVWNARGNTSTCDASGFVLILATTANTLYLTSKSIYYLCVVKFNKSEAYIKDKIEPWIHGVSIIYPSFVAIFLLSTKSYNPQGPICGAGQYINFQCVEGVDENGNVMFSMKEREVEGTTIPCGRGGPNAQSRMMGLVMPAVFGNGLVIVVCMAMIYKIVLENENKMEKYGVRAIRQRASIRNILDSTSDSERSELSMLQKIKNTLCCGLFKSRNQRSKKALVLKQALASTMSWFASYTMVLVFLFIILATRNISETPYWVQILMVLTYPLQGFFHLLSYIVPKIIQSKRANRTWFQAFVFALTSKHATTLSKKERRSRQRMSIIAWGRRKRLKKAKKISSKSNESTGSSLTKQRIPKTVKWNDDIENGNNYQQLSTDMELHASNNEDDFARNTSDAEIVGSEPFLEGPEPKYYGE